MTPPVCHCWVLGKVLNPTPHEALYAVSIPVLVRKWKDCNRNGMWNKTCAKSCGSNDPMCMATPRLKGQSPREKKGER